MAKEDLVPMSERTKEEQKKIATMGGKASGKARKEKATMKKVLEQMLEEIPTKNNDEKLTYKQLATLGLIKGAVYGNNANYKTILETIGEIQEMNTPIPTLKIEVSDNSNLEKDMYEENRHNKDDKK